ncbi:MAG: hypothetical protein R3253_07180 [Longimicrobiales bacterium]|nr:hypothetical protein [Longimicrobiales bacterium]
MAQRLLHGWILTTALVVALVVPRPACGQQGDGGATAAIDTSDDGWSLLGRPPKEPLAVGSMLYAVHPFIDTSKYKLISDNMDGAYVRSGQLFLAGFRNSYNDQSWVVAVERHWGTTSLWLLDFGVGYRAGIVTGYDERLVWLAGYTPILPLWGVVGWVHAGPVGGTAFWAYRAISLEATLRCC